MRRERDRERARESTARASSRSRSSSSGARGGGGEGESSMQFSTRPASAEPGFMGTWTQQSTDNNLLFRMSQQVSGMLSLCVAVIHVLKSVCLCVSMILIIFFFLHMCEKKVGVTLATCVSYVFASLL